MPLASQKWVEGISRFGRDSEHRLGAIGRDSVDSVDWVAIRSRFGRDLVASMGLPSRSANTEDKAQRRQNVAKTGLHFGVGRVDGSPESLS